MPLSPPVTVNIIVTTADTFKTITRPPSSSPSPSSSPPPTSGPSTQPPDQSISPVTTPNNALAQTTVARMDHRIHTL
ncbi:MAG: hypothetical protein MPJ79_07335, partial [Alphaproteobacteria bacterium]|nr:hypothetical protein [Alphaproteobacteria bacterium]